MTPHFQVTRVNVVYDKMGVDRVYLHTDMPSNIVGGNREVVLSFELRRNTAEEWLLDHFGVAPDSIVRI
jgi:hypothetical protein